MSRSRAASSHPMLAVAAAASLLAGLAGCAPEPINAVELAPLSCVAGTWNGGPDRSTTDDCSAPHRFEAVASLGEWDFRPEEFGVEDAAPQEIYERLVLAEPGDEFAVAYRSWAEPACQAAFLELLGLERVVVGDSTGSELGLKIDAPYTLVTSLSTREQYVLGDRTTLCAVAWLDGAGGPAQVAHLPGADLRALAGPGLAPDRRECFLFDDGTSIPASCAEPHSSQVVVDVDALAGLGADWVADVDPATGRARDYRAADALCEAVLVQLLPEGAFGAGRTAWADIRPIDGWVSYNGTVDADARYPISCAVAVASSAALLEGDVWGEWAVPEPTPTGTL